MTPLGNLFDGNRTGRVCFLGLGNPEYGDDGFGVRLAEELIKAGVPDVIIAGTTPEHYLGRIAEGEFDELVFLDAVECGAEAGSIVMAGSREMAARFPQISTHKISLAVLAKLVESNGKTRVWLLGVQPGSLKPGEPLSPAVQKAAKIVGGLLYHEPHGLIDSVELEHDLGVPAC